MLHLEHLVNDHQVLLPTCGTMTQLNTQLSTCTTMCSNQLACTCVLPHYTHHAPHQHTPQRLSAKYQFPNIQPIHVSANPNNNLILKLRTSAYQKPIFLYARYTFLMFSCEQQVNNFISSKKTALTVLVYTRLGHCHVVHLYNSITTPHGHVVHMYTSIPS